MKRRKRLEQPGGDVVGAERVGALLRARREARGLSGEEVAQAIRCAPARVVAVEEGRFDQLPPPPYGSGLVAAYAALLGIDGPALVRAAAKDLGVVGAGAARRLSRRSLDERFSWRNWSAPLVCAAALAAALAARALLTPLPAPLPEPAPAPAPASPGAEAPVAPPPLAAGQPAQQPPPLAAAPAPEPPAAAPAAASGVRVLLRSEGTTWVEASPDGAPFARHELGPGENLELAARDRLSLTLGDAGVLRITVNERELGFIGYKGETKAGVSFTAPKAVAKAPAAPANGD
jgi:transcriptional regulator with XRE-family HTH domain